MVVNLRRGAPDSAGTTLPSAGGLLRDPSCSQLDPSRTLPIGELLPRSQILCAVSGCRTQKKKKKKKGLNMGFDKTANVTRTTIIVKVA